MFRELSRARHQGDGQAGPARRARVRTRRRPRPGTADLRRDRVEDRQARAGGRPGEPHEARGERLDRGARGDPPLPAEPSSALGVLAQERLPIAIGIGDAQGARKADSRFSFKRYSNSPAASRACARSKKLCAWLISPSLNQKRWHHGQSTGGASE